MSGHGFGRGSEHKGFIPNSEKEKEKEPKLTSLESLAKINEYIPVSEEMIQGLSEEEFVELARTLHKTMS